MMASIDTLLSATLSITLDRKLKFYSLEKVKEYKEGVWTMEHQPGIADGYKYCSEIRACFLNVSCLSLTQHREQAHRYFIFCKGNKNFFR